MRKKRRKLTYDMAKDVASKCKSRSEFEKKDPSLYNKSMKEKWLGDICAHMEPLNISWDNKEVVKERYYELYVENNYTPVTQKQIQNSKYSTLSSKIVEHYGSKENLEMELDIVPLRRNRTEESTFEEYKNLCIKVGNRPATQNECNQISGLNSAISKFFGNKTNLDIKLGYTPYRISLTKEEFIDLYKEICHENGNKATALPKSYKGHDLRKTARKLFGSKENLDIELGYKPLRINRTKESTMEEYKKLCIDNGNNPVKHKDIKDGLSDAILKFFGSKMNLDSLLGYKPAKNYDWDEPTTKSIYSGLCIDNGDKPISTNDLIKMGHNDLVTAIGRHCSGGKIKLDIDLGYDTINTYYIKDEVKSSYHNLCIENGDKPLTQNDLHILGYSKLLSAIYRYYPEGKTQLDLELGYVPSNTYLLNNGILVRSQYEVLFANYLISNNIEFEYDKLISEETGYRYDFLIKDVYGNDLYVEIWGYYNESKRSLSYKDIKNKKIKIYNDMDIKLVSISGKLFKERNNDELQEDLKKILIENNIKLSDFVSLTPNEIISSKKLDERIGTTKEDYVKLCMEYGRLLTQKELFEITGSTSLYKNIYKCFGSKENLDNILTEEFGLVRKKIKSKYTFDICMGLVDSRSELHKKHSGAYKAAKREGWLDKLFPK